MSAVHYSDESVTLYTGHDVDVRWLVRLVIPPGGTVLDPFAGSGTTAEACVIEGFRAVAISTTTTDNARMRDSWNARKDSTWIDKL